MNNAARNIRGRLLSGSAWAVISTGLRTAIAFVSVPLTLSYLGTDRMGLWRVAASVLAVVSLLDAGLVPHLKTRMAAAYGRGDRDSFNIYSSTSMFMAVCLLAMGALATVAAPLVNWTSLLHVTDSLAMRETVPLIVVMIACSFSQFASNFILSVYDARMDVTKPRVYAALSSLAGFGMLLLGVYLKVSLPWLAFLTASPGIAARLPLLVGLLREDVSMVRPHLRVVRPVLREVLAAGSLSIGVQLANVALSSAPVLLVAHCLTLADVTTFSICYQLTALPLTAIGAIVPVFWPAFTIAWSQGHRHRLRRWLGLAIGGTAAALALYAVLMATSGVWVISAWTRGKVQAQWLVMATLGAFVLVQGCLHWISTFMWSIGAIRIQLFTQLGAAAILLGLGLFMTQWWGLVGAATALTVALTVGCLGPMFHRALKELRTDVLPQALQAPAMQDVPSTQECI